MAHLQDPICLAQIGAAHGIKGHVRVKPFTEVPEGLSDYGQLFTEDGSNKYKIAFLRAIKGGMLVVKFKGVNDRNQAEALNGTKLYIERSRLPELEDDDFYIEDLVGLDVKTTDDEPFGKISAVQNFGADDLLEVRPTKGKSEFIPFTKAAVPEVSIANGFIRISLEEAGLISNDDDEEGEIK